jgi:hypothetical protein
LASNSHNDLRVFDDVRAWDIRQKFADLTALHIDLLAMVVRRVGLPQLDNAR